MAKKFSIILQKLAGVIFRIELPAFQVEATSFFHEYPDKKNNPSDEEVLLNMPEHF